MQESYSRWNWYNEWNERHPEMTQIWLAKLARWLVSQPETFPPSTRLLDYGCGGFQLRALLGKHFSRLDGFDPDGTAIQRARETGADGALFDKSSQIPRAHYDVILLNSVVQYFSGDEELANFLKTARDLLRREGGKIVLSDLIPKNYFAPAAAFHSLILARKKKLLWPWIRHLWKAATKPRGLELYKISFSYLKLQAEQNGYEIQMLPENLTPGHQRYSVLLSVGPRAF